MKTREELNRIESKINDFGLAYGLGELFLAVCLWWMWGMKLLMPGDTTLEFLITLAGIGVLGRVLHFFRIKYIAPRTGYLKRNNFSKRELMKAFYMLPLGLILFVPLFVAEFNHGFTELAAFTKTYLLLIMGIAFAIFLYLAGKIGHFRRLKYYGFVLGFTIGIKQFFPISFDHLKVFWSLLFVFSGSVQFYRFIKKHPLDGRNKPEEIEGLS